LKVKTFAADNLFLDENRDDFHGRMNMGMKLILSCCIEFDIGVNYGS
jgi:hypothetical protein